MRTFVYRLCIALSLITGSYAYPQAVGIGSEKFTPHPSAVLELRTNAKGLLIPRLTEVEKQGISSPAEGLLIYQTDNEKGFYLYTDSQWTQVLTQLTLPEDDNQQLSFDMVNYTLTLENGGVVDLSILRNGRSLTETIDNGDGTFTFKYNDGTSFTTRNLQGPRGNKGEKGIDGADGRTILNGNSNPNNGQGKNGDLFINTNSNTLFGPKTSGNWGSGIPLVGPAGKDGIDGTNGTDGIDGKTILSGNTDPNNALGNDGDIYINTASNTFFGPKAAGAWGAGTSLVGPAGADGTDGVDGADGADGADGIDGKTILSGNADPNNALGNDGDIYINIASNSFFGPKTAGAWGAGTSLVGPAGANGTDGVDGVDGADGADGIDGKTILSGNTDPNNALGNDGDIYINTASNTFFGPKTAGAWGASTSLVGPAGADGTDGVDGVDGADGADGIDGKTILSGNTDPNNTLGNDGDIYINTASNTFFGPKTAGAWGAGTSLVGPAGANGTDGVDGVDGADGADGIDGKTILSGNTDPNNALGNDGDIYINTASNTFFGPKTTGAWGAGTSLVGPAGADGNDGVDGADGADGADGIDGKTILSGNTDPNNTLGNDGDIYINTASNAFFGPKTAGAWGAGTSLVGPAGADGVDGVDGADGADGKTVLNGSANPTNAIGTEGDFYYNYNTFTFFGPKTAIGWPSGVVLKGTGILSTSDNPDGSLTFNFTDGTSFTSQPDGDFSDANELITSLSLIGSSLQITEGGSNKSVDLSSISTSSSIVDPDNNTSITVNEGNANDDIIRFKVQGNEVLRLNNRTLEFLSNNGSVFIGEGTGLSSTGAGNLALGSEAMKNNTSGRFNVAIGYRALRQNTTGQGNVAIGYNAGFNETGNNKLYIDNSNTNSPLVWGDFSSDLVNINGKLGVGIANPATITDEFEVNGNATVISLTETSDRRFKKNINQLESSLDKLLSLRGVSYEWRIDEFPDRRFNPGNNLGLIAQEVQAIFPELVSTNREGFLSVSYSGFAPVLIEAIKEQQQQISDLEQALEKANNNYEDLLKRVLELEKNSKKQ
ncbi:tail fiber domain-containing protein [Roseivirga sp.]|uniref:tail fiber domain-containing protein n=1 Tax=Roseivirga sp. TaxID=1964215 RepID=UPI003B525217